MKALSSKLNNRVEIWGKEKKETSLGVNYEEVLINKVWANIIPVTGYLRKGEANTEYSDTSLKIRIRKTDISQSKNWIIFEGERYDIKYIHRDFQKNRFIDLFVNINEE